MQTQALAQRLRIWASLTLIFSIMTSYARARAESLVEKCKVGFMERPERIVLFMIGALTNRMAAVLWVILILSILAVADRIYYTFLALNKLPMPSREGVSGIFNRAFFWTDERATLPYDLWVIAILSFVWLTPPMWLGDPTAQDAGLVAWVIAQYRAIAALPRASTGQQRSRFETTSRTTDCGR